MKKTLFTLLAVAGLSLSALSANADDVIFSGVTGASGSITQAITGGDITFTWSGDFSGDSASGTSQFFDNQVDGSSTNTNIVSFNFTPATGFMSTADWTIRSQRSVTGATTNPGLNAIADSAILSTDGIFDITAQTGVTSLVGDGSNQLTYGDVMTDTRGQFDTDIYGASTFSYDYTVTNGGGFRDPFAVSVTGIPVAVPEPTSAAILLAGGIALLARRKRT